MSRARSMPRHRFAPRTPWVPRLASLALLSALTLGSACKGESSEQAEPKPEAEAIDKGIVAKPTPPLPAGALANTRDSAPIADHGEVIATAQLPSGAQLSDIAAVLEAIQPGASMMVKLQGSKLLEQAVGLELSDAKLDAPISVVVLDPNAHERPFALLLEAKDSAALIAKAKAAGYETRERDGHLLIGAATVLSTAEDFAFTHLTKYPDHSEFILYPALLLNAYADTIERALDQIGPAMAQLGTSNGNSNEAMTKMMRTYTEGAIALGRETDRVVFSVAAASGSADLITRIYPVDGSVFASFVAAQVPADHALLSKLPAAQEGVRMLMSGDIRAGGARDVLVDFGIEFMGTMYKGLAAGDWDAIMKRWLDNLDGRFAMSTTLNIGAGQAAMDMQALMGTGDSEVLRAAWREMLELMVAQPTMEMMGMKLALTYQRDALVHDEVSVDLYTTEIDPSMLPAQQRATLEAAGNLNQRIHLAAFDQVAVIATADEASRSIKSVIDTNRGRGQGFQPTQDFTAALATSKDRSESALMYFDMSNVPEAGTQLPFRAIAMSMGKDGQALGIRVSLRK